MLLVDLVVLALATWRVTNLILYERGPEAILQSLRKRFGIDHDEDGEPISWPDDSEWGLLLRCLDCSSVWIGLVLAGIYLVNPPFGIGVCLPFALSGGAILIGKAVHYG